MIVLYWVDIFSILSNVIFFLPAYEAYKRNRKLRALIYFFMAWASGLYHTCLGFDVCLFTYEFHHYLDFFFAQFLIIVAGSYLIIYNNKYRYLDYWILAIGALGIVILQVTLEGSLLIQAGIVSFVFVGLVFYWMSTAAIHSLPKYEWDMFLLGLSLTGGSITLFVFQNSWYQAYWLIHSVWHIAAGLGQYYLVKLKRPFKGILPAARRI